MNFASDNTGPAHPRVIEAIVKANDGYAMPYGADPIMAQVTATIRDLFEAPTASVHLVTTGTAANSIALACLCRPFETVFCADIAHIHEDECGAPEFFTGGAKLSLVPHDNGKMTATALQARIRMEETRGVHGPQRGPVSLTQVTEKGTTYTLDELSALTGVARSFGLGTHMDGARFANALVHLGCTPAQMSWRAGIDVLSFGGTKNGVLGAEAVIFFDPSHGREFALRRKRAGHLMSKHRFLSAQMLAYLTDDLWLDMARTANLRCAELARGLKQRADTQLLFEPDANIIFARFPRAVHQRLHHAGATYYIMDGELAGDDPQAPLLARLVCDWSATPDAVARFLRAMDT